MRSTTILATLAVAASLHVRKRTKVQGVRTPCLKGESP